MVAAVAALVVAGYSNNWYQVELGERMGLVSAGWRCWGAFAVAVVVAAAAHHSAGIVAAEAAAAGTVHPVPPKSEWVVASYQPFAAAQGSFGAG